MIYIECLKILVIKLYIIQSYFIRTYLHFGLAFSLKIKI